jgi:hypothetical protein
MIPERFAFEMINRGWILRAKIPWVKAVTIIKRDEKGLLDLKNMGSCMPESTTDRPTKCWEPIYMFVKGQKYWYEQQFTTICESTKKRKTATAPLKTNDADLDSLACSPNFNEYLLNKGRYTPLGANMREAWMVQTSKTKEKHFATYAVNLCTIPIKSGCPAAICSKCGVPRYPVVGGAVGANWKEIDNRPNGPKDALEYGYLRPHGLWSNLKDKDGKAFQRHVEYTSCACNAPFQPGIVLDPFFGTGTTAVAAIQEHRQWVGIELSPEYMKFAETRLSKLGCEIGSAEKKALARKVASQGIGKLEAFIS